MFSFRSRSQGKPVLLADVESGSAAVAIGIVTNDNPLQIIASERAMLPIEKRSDEQSASAVGTLLGEIATRVVKNYSESEAGKKHGPVLSVHCTVGAPWVRSRTAKQEKKFPAPTTVTDALIKELAKQALEQPSELASDRTFEMNVTRVQLNGYPTAKPLGKQATNVIVIAFQSDIDPAARSGIENALGTVAPGRTINLRSHTRAMLSVLHERTDSPHYTVITVGSDFTSCTSLYKEELMEHAIVPEGIFTILHRTGGPTGSPEETLSLLKMVASDTCSMSACEELKSSIAKIEPELVKSFAEVFAKLSVPRRLPNACFVSSHADFAPWLEHFFGRLDFSPFTTTMQPFTVEPLTPDHVREFVFWNPGTREDTGIGLVAAFVHITQVAA